MHIRAATMMPTVQSRNLIPCSHQLEMMLIIQYTYSIVIHNYCIWFQYLLLSLHFLFSWTRQPDELWNIRVLFSSKTQRLSGRNHWNDRKSNLYSRVHTFTVKKLKNKRYDSCTLFDNNAVDFSTGLIWWYTRTHM